MPKSELAQNATMDNTNSGLRVDLTDVKHETDGQTAGSFSGEGFLMASPV